VATPGAQVTRHIPSIATDAALVKFSNQKNRNMAVVIPVTRSAARPEPWSTTPEPSGCGHGARHAVNGWVARPGDLSDDAARGLAACRSDTRLLSRAGVTRRRAEGKPVAISSI
jgi:hypothetical protein